MGVTARPELRLLWYSACAAAAREIAANAFDITVEVILAPQRGRAHISTARQVAMYMAHTICSVPLVHVAVSFRRDRTTASYACHRIEDMRDDEYFNGQLEVLERQLVSRMYEIERCQLTAQKSVIEHQTKMVVGGAPEQSVLISSENGRLLTFKPFKG